MALSLHGINTPYTHVLAANELNCPNGAGAARGIAAMDGPVLLPRPDARAGPLPALLLRSGLPGAGQGPACRFDEPEDRCVSASAGGALPAVDTGHSSD